MDSEQMLYFSWTKTRKDYKQSMKEVYTSRFVTYKRDMSIIHENQTKQVSVAGKVNKGTFLWKWSSQKTEHLKQHLETLIKRGHPVSKKEPFRQDQNGISILLHPNFIHHRASF
jgi:hypothetical protein